MTEEKLCPACGQPQGTGTLLDFAPEPPLEGFPPDIWREFAERYRCPPCADALPDYVATRSDDEVIEEKALSAEAWKQTLGLSVKQVERIAVLIAALYSRGYELPGPVLAEALDDMGLVLAPGSLRRSIEVADEHDMTHEELRQRDITDNPRWPAG